MATRGDRRASRFFSATGGLVVAAAATLALAACSSPGASVDAAPTEQVLVTSEAFPAVGAGFRIVDVVEGLDSPDGVAIAPDGETMYLSGGGGDATGIARIEDDGGVEWLGDGLVLPGALAVTDDAVWVADRGAGGVDVSHDEGETWRSIGAQELGLEAPEGLGASGDVVVVTDPAASRVVVSGDGGESWVEVVSPTAGFASPIAAAVAPGGTIYVLNQDGSLSVGPGSVSIGLASEGPASERAGDWRNVPADVTGFVAPVGIAAGTGGDLYVTDPGSGALARSTDRGESWDAAAGFANAWGVAVGPDRHVYVTDDVDTIVELEAVAAAPADLDARRHGGDVEVTWSVPTVDGGSSVTGYRVAVEPRFDRESWEAAFPGVDPQSEEATTLEEGWTVAVEAGSARVAVPGVPSGVALDVVVIAENGVGSSLPAHVVVSAS